MNKQRAANKHPEDKTAKAIFWIVSLGALVLGAGAIAYPFRVETKHSKIIESLGEALLIAGFLSLTVDRYVKHQLVQEVSHDIARLIFGYQLPPTAEATFKDLLMGWRVIRENLVIHWAITPAASSSDKLDVTVTFSFTVRNYGNSEEPYTQSVFAEDHDTPTIAHLQCVRTQEGVAKKTIYDYKAPNITIDASDRGVKKAFGDEIAVKPYANGKGPTYEMEASYSMVLPAEYSDVFAFAGPTGNVKIHAVVDPKTKVVFMAEDTADGSTNPWSYDKFYLAKQYLRVRWYKELPALPAQSGK